MYRFWQAKLAVGGNNPGSITAATNSKTGQYLADFSGSSILDEFNATKKVGILIEFRIDEGLLLTEIKYLAVKT